MRRTSITTFALMVACVATARLHAEDRPLLHPLFSDNMVLQRELPVPIWGWSTPGHRVRVTLEGRKGEAVADAQGKWMLRLGPFPAGGPYSMVVDEEPKRVVTIKNVLIGDVWIASGQSNMEMGIGGVNNARAEIERGDFPKIRLFTVAKRTAIEPQELVDGQWAVCSPEALQKTGFSAVAYFFGRDIHKDVKVPIGLIHSSWGGTVAEAWTSAEALKAIADFHPALSALEHARDDMKRGVNGYELRMDAWWRKIDPGSAEGMGWADPALDDSTWKTINLPERLEDAALPDFDGVVWFRKEIELPDDWAGKDAILHLGPVDDIDTTFVNGKKVGSTDEWDVPRRYRVARSVLKPGRNVIAVRAFDMQGAGGIYGRPDELKLERVGGRDPATISLVGPWRFKASAPKDQVAPKPERLDGNPNAVAALYNGMIAPLVPFAIKGAIWYQGESNVGRAVQYRTLLPTMIADWRARFHVGEFPFMIVQLANFLGTNPEPRDSAWAELREAQWLATKAVPKAGLAVAIDIGEAADIHPRNKQDVGRRLALAALALAYGGKKEYSGPTYRDMIIEGNRVRLRFDHVGGGLVAKGGGKLTGFAVAGADRRFVWADARIDGDEIVLSARGVEKPTAVRYAWADNPICNLTNKAGLPAVPFRTDRPEK